MELLPIAVLALVVLAVFDFLLRPTKQEVPADAEAEANEDRTTVDIAPPGGLN
jgi:hypothetical protein